MKKFGFKKMLSAVMAASIVTGSVSAINALAASPRIYVDIVYEDANTPRADIYFENVPRLKDIGIHLSIGDGWDTAKSPFGGVKYTKIGTTSNVNGGFYCRKADYDDNVLFITFAGTDGNYDFNGKFLSIYLEKTDDYTSENSTINVFSIDGDMLWQNTGGNTGVNYITSVMETTPIMLRADEYIIGDANGDHFVDARDASEILTGIKNDEILSVYEIRNSYKDIFTKAEAPAAPDADQNGYIEKADAIETLRYYADTATGTPYEGRIGSINVYETYND